MRNDKLKDMIRSILPSKNREAARLAKALESRRTRRGVRADVRLDNPKADLNRDADQSENVSWRRGGDKLNHFMRWCEAITDGMTLQESLDYVRSILPRNLIGDHAYGHWEDYRRYRGRYASYSEQGQRRLQSFIDSAVFRLRRALIVDPTLHGRLNAEIKTRKPVDQPRRLLAGVHDVGDFVRAIAPSRYWFETPNPHDLERAITLELIEWIERTKGGRKVALRVLGETSVAKRVGWLRL
jgi:hypothetical protein